MMMIYDKLYHIEGSVEVNQFPLGLVSVRWIQNTYAIEIRQAILNCITKFFTKFNNYDNDPCLIFSFLEGWYNNRPDDDDDYCDAYETITQGSKDS